MSIANAEGLTKSFERGRDMTSPVATRGANSMRDRDI